MSTNELPEVAEAGDVDRLVELRAALKPLGATRLLYGKSPLLALLELMNQPEAKGALAPRTAHASLSRQAIRRKELRRKSMRSGHLGLARAIAAA